MTFTRWLRRSASKTEREIAFRPARVLMQDFTGVPAIVDLATMRDVVKEMGGDPDQINPLQPVDLVIDHLGAGGSVRYGLSVRIQRGT